MSDASKRREAMQASVRASLNAVAAHVAACVRFAVENGRKLTPADLDSEDLDATANAMVAAIAATWFNGFNVAGRLTNPNEASR